ncbi:MAG: hypothetical protein J6K73_06550 [Clostridia bacterium]|nr:hypothetical protein [Clostridia bacterium]MBP3649427.1 hypothetical protein [Clostridia bacterium]
MFRRAGRRWGRAMGWILLLTFIVTLTFGVYITLYEPQRYVAQYTLAAVREEGDTPAPLSMWMLLRDYNRLLDDADFRQQIVTVHTSDGQTFISARGTAVDHMVTIQAVGREPEIVCTLADAVGDKLVAESDALLGVSAARTVKRARLLPQPTETDVMIRILKTMLITFGVLSVLAILFGSRREPVGWLTPPEQMNLPVMGQVAECGEECEYCRKQLRRKKTKPADCRLLTHVDRLVREGMEEAALSLRSCAGMRSCSLAVAGIRAEDQAPAFAVLLAQTLAEDGYSVLMMDMDGDAPMLSRYLGVSGQVDVVDCLADDSQLPMALLRTSTPNLHLIDCCHDGETVRQAAASPAFADFARNALAVYDYVILHAPPAAFGGGAAAVGGAADQMVLVARDKRYTAKELTGVAEGLRQRAVRLGGVVFTGVKKRQLKSIYKADGKAYRKERKSTVHA